MTDAHRSLCGDLAFACSVGCIGQLVGLVILSRLGVTLYPLYDYGGVAVLAVCALLLGLSSLPPEAEEQTPEKTKTPE